MNDTKFTAPDPRWGEVDRDRKADAVLRTLQLHCGCNMTTGQWLDVGCGSGGIAATLASRVERVVGIDPEPWQRWDDFCGQHSNLDFHRGTYRDLDELVGAESCDVVVCNQVYEHVDDPSALLAAIHGVLKPNGVCYFAGPNLLWPIEPHVFWPFVHWLPRGFAIRLMKMLGSRRAEDLDAWLWPYRRLIHNFRATGFHYESAVRERVQAMHSNSAAVRLLSHMPHWLYSALLPVSPGFVFVLRKSRPSVDDFLHLRDGDTPGLEK